VERTAWGYEQWAPHRSGKDATRLCGPQLVGVAKEKPGCSHIPGFGDVRELLTLTNVDGDLTSLSDIFHVLAALILGTILNSELLQVGIQDFGETFDVQAVAANPSSCHPRCVVVARKA
jgi:hypothetical protein